VDAATLDAIPPPQSYRAAHGRAFTIAREVGCPISSEANREALDAYLRYHFEQSLSSRRPIIEDVFVPELMDT
jgi:hypothetical protein